ncbi:MAG: hypothetical protein A4S09_16345 [Proteobacteria bacterium SG_bin7]|nr:MAG: hypothetical protein A4S09_16345 [Proteobacteria bacterium SG_bin7]
MSAIGKGSLSLRKKDVTTQKSIGVGFTKVVFAHKATGGESSINLNSLSTPSELSSQGFVQPSPSTLTGLNIYFYRRNLTLISSLRGVLMDFLSYTVASNTLIKLSGFTLEPNEIIVGVVDPMPRNELLVVDGEAIAATGELAVGVTDFAVGTPFETNKYPTQQIGAVKVYRNGLLQARCEGNSLVNDGNYIEVPVSGGLGSLIRFKTAPVNQADNIIVTSNGAYFERPSASMMANIEALGGQLDKVVEVLSDVSGQPETYFQANPSQVDLRQFGDRVIALEQNKEDKYSIPFQTKTLPSNISVNTSDITSLRFNSLQVGKRYRVTAQVSVVAGDNAGRFLAHHNGNTILRVENQPTGAGPNARFVQTGVAVFTATASTVVFSFTVLSVATLEGSGAFDTTWVMLEELPQHEPTTQWT